MEAVSLRWRSAKRTPAADCCNPHSRRRDRAQRPRRDAEARVRQLAVTYSQQSAQHGLSATQIASQLGVSSRTLRHWRSETVQNGAGRRGRPTKTCPTAQRNEVIRFLREVSGPAVGLAALRALFQNVPRCILQDLLRRYRRVWVRRYRQSGFQLTWHHAGTVWAIDFSEASHPIDGVHEFLFAVRDLASHQQLAWHPFHGQTAQETVVVLEDLFRLHGPPLVLKSDNGSAFIAQMFQERLQAWGVSQLFSPARHPQYNGALERSNGTLKTYTHQHAIREGHPFRWTAEDVEQARQLANTLSRPWGHRGPTPEEAWQARAAITPEQRLQFLDLLARQQLQARTDMGLDATADLNLKDQSRVNRLAISRTLVQLEHLTMRRVQRPPKKAKRLSHGDLTVRALRNRAAPSVPRLTYQPTLSNASQSSGALATDGAPSVVSPAVADHSVADVSIRAGALRPSSSAGAPIPAPHATSAALSAPSPPIRKHGAPRATFRSLSVVALPASTDARAPVEKPPRSLATPAADDTMRRQAGVGAITSMLSPAPRAAHSERPYTSWLRRTITLIIRLAKTAIISRL